MGNEEDDHIPLGTPLVWMLHRRDPESRPRRTADRDMEVEVDRDKVMFLAEVQIDGVRLPDCLG